MDQTLILGRRRQGKSTLAAAVGISTGKSVIVFDPDNQFSAWPHVLTLEALADYMESGALYPVVYQPSRLQIAEEWAAFAEVLWEFEDYALIVDEASLLQSAGYKDEHLERFLRRAPDSVSIIQTTHRVVDVCKLARQNANSVFCFQTGVKADLDMLQADVCEAIPGLIRDLPPYHVMHYWRGQGGKHNYGVWRNPRVWDTRISIERRAA